ncbi:hypothetical protein [Ligilactobacillus salitolerans]|nr:hypothetical protein [Ligilactobacillus salitolerans]
MEVWVKMSSELERCASNAPGTGPLRPAAFGSKQKLRDNWEIPVE